MGTANVPGFENGEPVLSVRFGAGDEPARRST